MPKMFLLPEDPMGFSGTSILDTEQAYQLARIADALEKANEPFNSEAPVDHTARIADALEKIAEKLTSKK